ncbi:pectinesterase family protein [Pedobacter sp. SYSU D00535]|uniref:pectinesterase family protein n=1 Tax=Pedobacter sp. SYSU D00535 TaxID=2810308 RepID=UPI001A975A78|nr:pectinesterase family protein [Pedobacter sp. SYSU D00535]
MNIVRFFCLSLFLIAEVQAHSLPGISTIDTLKPDVVVAQDGSGLFKTIGEALLYVTNSSSHRVIIYIKDGIYTEKVSIHRPNVTLVGQSRKGTRIAYSIPAGNESISRGVLNIFGNGVVLENLTVENTYPHRRHTFALYGRGSFVLTKNCDFIAKGNDTVALWAEGGGYYYHDNCHFEGNIDFLCPRGWCYVNNSTFYEVDTRAALWHDGGKDPNKKLVIKNSKFDGARKYALGRYPRDSQFYLISCHFSDSTENIIDTNAPAARNEEFQWGRRVFFYDCDRAGGNTPWLKDNLHTAAGAPKAKDITAKWTFDGVWDPESTAAPQIKDVKTEAPYRVVQVVFSEPVTVRGLPVIITRKGKTLKWTKTNGSNVITFSALDAGDAPLKIDVQKGSIFASSASTSIRYANLRFPKK